MSSVQQDLARWMETFSATDSATNKELSQERTFPSIQDELSALAVFIRRRNERTKSNPAPPATQDLGGLSTTRVTDAGGEQSNEKKVLFSKKQREEEAGR